MCNPLQTHVSSVGHQGPILMRRTKTTFKHGAFLMCEKDFEAQLIFTHASILPAEDFGRGVALSVVVNNAPLKGSPYLSQGQK